MKYIVSTYSFAANLSDPVVEVLSKTKTVIHALSSYKDHPYKDQVVHF